MNPPSATPQRRYDLDWLRVLAIVGVFIYHCSLVFAPDPYSIKNATLYEFLDDWGGFAGTWGLSLVFLISGASVFYALGKVGPGKYVKGIVLRLIVPLLVGVFTHIAFQVYLERLHNGEFSGSFFEFYPHYFDGMYAFGGNFAWMGMHLWYLEALFLFSMVCLPLFSWLRNAASGRRALQALGDVLAKPGAAYLFALPAYVLINVLDPETLGADLLGDWSIFIYLTFFVSGFVIFSHARLQESIGRLRWVSLAAGILLWGMIDFVWGALGDPDFGTWGFALGTIPWCLNAWCWLLAILGFGMRHLSFSTPFLKYTNEAVLPFYILHQTVVLSLSYFVVQWAIPDGLKFMTILVGSLAASVGLYECLVRRSNLMRVLFGMRPKARQPMDVRSALAGQGA
jgi:peptidoglycan/LPS O-acetylase OafA/YrhL